MKICLGIFLFAAATVANAAAAPVLPAFAAIASRTSGTAPLCVFFDATGTTDTDTSAPFHDLIHTVNFGDASAGTWPYGANTDWSKNYHVGPPVAAHCYSTPNTYTVTWQVSDGTNVVLRTGTITVADPDTVYSGNNTSCIANVTATAGSGGCPSGAATPAGTNDFDAALSTCKGTGKRCLFKRGDSFQASASVILGAATGMSIGAYGTGSQPVITGTTCLTAGMIGIDSANDLRIADLNMDGAQTTTPAGNCVLISGALTGMSQLSILNNTMGGATVPIQFQGGGVQSTLWDQIFVVGNVITGYGRVDVADGYGMYLTGTRLAIMGNWIDNPNGTHLIRITETQKAVIQHNTLLRCVSTRDQLKLHASPFGTTGRSTQYVSLSDNRNDSTGNLIITIGPEDAISDERVKDVVIERNYHTVGAAGNTADQIWASNVTVRNELIDMSNGSNTQFCVAIARRGIEPAADTVKVYNITCYTAKAVPSTQLHAVDVDASVTNVTVKNVLAYAPSAINPSLVGGAGAAGATKSNNSLDTNGGNGDGTNGVKKTPSLDGALTSPSGFRPGIGGYGVNGGTSVVPAINSDFFNCSNNASHVRIGAFEPRTEATCRGVAGP